jgi:hypothetical protein
MNRFRTTLLLLVVASSVYAGNGGSGYSIYGLGDIQYFSSSSSMAMGGAGLAMMSPFSIDRSNPALWTAINRVRISVSSLYEGYSTSDYQTSGYFAGMQFSGAIIAIPIVSKYGITFSAGATPYSRINYNIVTPATQEGYEYSIHYIGDGGLSQAHIGISGLLGADLSLGMKLDYYFGTLQHTIEQAFTSTGFTTAQVDHLTRMNGVGFTFGFVYSGLRNLFQLPEGHSFNIAAVVSSSPYLTAGEERYYTYTTTSATSDTITYPTGKFHLPLRLAGGLAYETDRWSIASDFISQHWSNATYDGSPVTDIRDSYRWSLGGELTQKNSTSNSLSPRTMILAGIYYDATYYRIKGVAINELGVSMGYSLPVFNDSRLGIAAEYGFRGTTDQQLQKDRILRISLTMTIGEIWFVKPTEE